MNTQYTGRGHDFSAYQQNNQTKLKQVSNLVNELIRNNSGHILQKGQEGQLTAAGFAKKPGSLVPQSNVVFIKNQ